MTRKGTLTALAVLLGVALAATGCTCGEKKKAETTTTTTTQQQSFIMDAEAFDLGTVTALLKTDLAKDLKALEAKINDPSSGINNVDIDGDGKIDYVGAKEREARDGFDFLAFPSSKGDNAEPVTVASVTITVNRQTKEVAISGGYPEYVHGYRDHHYTHHHHGMTFGQAFFLAWYLNAARPVYWHPMGYRSYYGAHGYRSVMPAQRLRTTRTSYRTTNKVSPVKKTTRPKNYRIKSAQKSKNRVKSRYSSKYKGKGSIKGNARGMRGYKARDRNRSRSRGSSFGKKRAAPRAPKGYRPGTGRGTHTPRTTRPSRSRGRSGYGRTTPSRSPSRGYRSPSRSRGGSSGYRSPSRSRSYGSPSRSRSYGGSRSRGFGGGRRRR